MIRMPVAEAKDHIMRSVGRPCTVKNWHRFRVSDDDVLVVITGSMVDPHDKDVEAWREYRVTVFVNGKPRMGDIIAA